MTIYQSLSRWFQKTQAVDLTKEQIGADYILSGEILAIDLPTVSWDTNSDATGTKVKLYVRYSLKDRRSGEILWEENNRLLYCGLHRGCGKQRRRRRCPLRNH